MQYTVIGLYRDNMQRYATCVEADSPDEAEEAAQEAARTADESLKGVERPLLVAGVAEGEIPMVDTKTYAEGP